MSTQALWVSVALLMSAAPALAQSAAATPDTTHRAAPTAEGRAGASDETQPGSPNGKGNALNGTLKAPDATRNNGQ